MQPFRNSEHQSFLDRLDSNNRQLWIRLGRQLKPDIMENIKKQIQDKYKLINQIRPYERYNKLKEQEIQLRELLQRFDNILDEQNQISQKLNKQGKQLLQIKERLLKLIQKISKAYELQQKVKKLESQVGNMEQISQKLDNNQIMQYLNCLQNVKQKILKEKRKIQDEITKLERKNKLMENYIDSQKELWQKLIKDKHLLQTNLSELKQKRMLLQMNKIAKQGQQLSNSSLKQPTKSQFVQNNYFITKNQTKHERMLLKSENPYCYKIWSLVLIIWAILLLYFWIFTQKQFQTQKEIIDACH